MRKMPAFHDNCFSTFPRTQRHDGHAIYRCEAARRSSRWWVRGAILILAVLSLAMLAACHDAGAAQQEEVEAMSSQDFSVRWVCGDRTPVWISDKEVECLKEKP